MGSFRTQSLGHVSSPRSGGRFYDPIFEDHQPPFLEACSPCKKQLGDNRHIFMYRQEKIEIDEAKEKNWNLSSMKSMRKEQNSSSASQSKSQSYSFSTGVVATT